MPGRCGEPRGLARTVAARWHGGRAVAGLPRRPLRWRVSGGRTRSPQPGVHVSAVGRAGDRVAYLPERLIPIYRQVVSAMGLQREVTDNVRLSGTSRLQVSTNAEIGRARCPWTILLRTRCSGSRVRSPVWTPRSSRSCTSTSHWPTRRQRARSGSQERGFFWPRCCRTPGRTGTSCACSAGFGGDRHDKHPDGVRARAGDGRLSCWRAGRAEAVLRCRPLGIETDYPQAFPRRGDTQCDEDYKGLTLRTKEKIKRGLQADVLILLVRSATCS